jgi:hypothetical protein
MLRPHPVAYVTAGAPCRIFIFAGRANGVRSAQVVGTKKLLLVALGCGGMLFAAGSAQSEIVARVASDGALALGSKGTPYVAYVRGTRVILTSRTGAAKWRPVTIAQTTPRATVKAFKVGPAGPVALVQSADDRTLVLVRKQGRGWETIRLASVPATMALGWPGLALDAKGLAVVSYTRWNSLNLNSQLQLVRVDARGRLSVQRITRNGFPQSLVPPPSVPVLVGGRAHVVEEYGYETVTAALEWYPDGKTWTGLGLDVTRGEFPIGPVLAGLLRGRLYVAWSISMAAYGAVPVTLVERINNASSAFVLERALTTGLALPAAGPEVAANEWVSADELGMDGDDVVWSGTVVDGEGSVGLDGWIGGLAASPRGGRDLLLERAGNLEWFRSPVALAKRVTIRAVPAAGGIAVSGRVEGASGGQVAIYRERPDGTRELAGTKQLAGESFSFTDGTAARPLLYRAVYTAPGTGIPYAALSRPIM